MNKNNLQPEESKFLSGPCSRLNELFYVSDPIQFIRVFRNMHFIGTCVTVFGSARFEPDNIYYHRAESVGAALAKLGFTIMKGGGQGIMEAASKGAYEYGGYSLGCNIILPF